MRLIGQLIYVLMAACFVAALVWLLLAVGTGIKALA